MKENILVFCAHSDDQILGLGGTIAKYSKQKKKVFTIIFSYGESGLLWLKPEVAIKTRVEESREADKLIGGAGVAFFGLKEGKFLEDPKETKKKIKKIIKLKKPLRIFIHHHDDPHPDHRAVNKSVMEALEELKYKCEIFSFDIWNPFTIRKTHLPRLYEDIDDTFKLKVEAIKLFKSQRIDRKSVV